jgi:hypothetical protein
MNTKSWISFHSYLPNFYIAENNFFYSGQNNCCEEFDFLVGELVPNPTTTTTTSTSTSSTTTTTTTVAPLQCNFTATVIETNCSLAGTGVIQSIDCDLAGEGEIGGTTTTTTSTSTSTTTTTSSSTTTTTTTTLEPTTTTTTTTTISPYCYVIESVQSAPSECFDCPGFFASTTDTFITFYDGCGGTQIAAPFDINVTAYYSDSSTGSTFIPSGATGSILIATSDIQCAPLPACGEVASPVFDYADVVPVTGSISECCVGPS